MNDENKTDEVTIHTITLNKKPNIAKLRKIIIKHLKDLRSNGDYIDGQFDVYVEAMRTFCGDDIMNYVNECIDNNTKF